MAIWGCDRAGVYSPAVRKSLAAAALALLCACQASAGRDDELQGTALSARGAVAGNEFGFSTDIVKVGGRYGFAFPELENNGKAMVTLQRVTIEHVPNGVRIVAYSMLDAPKPTGSSSRQSSERMLMTAGTTSTFTSTQSTISKLHRTN